MAVSKPQRSRYTASRHSTILAVVLVDVVLIVAFAAIGRRSHDEGLTLTGIAETAWPFLAGLAVGHLLVRGSRSVRAGTVVWLATVVLGMVLRRISGEGTAPSFVVVATLVTGALLLGWRVLAAVRPR
ncbi:MAG: DUF3054 domain-containing protein [Nocardioidaceae bacterium]|nr:MAG: DUF3054 domain-containing protein [Nocardioidaceae bacterium]